MSSYFLDTSVVINYLKNDTNTIEVIKNLKGEATSSYIVLSELYEGVYRSNDKTKTEKIILEFFEGLDTVYGIDKEIADNFGKTRTFLKKEGNVIEDIDIFIAATCLANNLTLITSNPKHFDRIKNLNILAI